MKQTVKRKWIALLTSGEFKQAKGKLSNREGTGMCCLGVLCELHRRETGKGRWELKYSPHEGKKIQHYVVGEESDAMGLPVVVQKWAGLESSFPKVFTFTVKGFFGGDIPKDIALSDLNDGTQIDSEKLPSVDFDWIAAFINGEL